MPSAAPSSGQSPGDHLLKVTEQIGTLAKDIHGFSRQIHPAILDDLGLAAAIRSECLAFSEQYGMPAEFTADDMPSEIPEDVALCLYRVAQRVSETSGSMRDVPGIRAAEKSSRPADPGD